VSAEGCFANSVTFCLSSAALIFRNARSNSSPSLAEGVSSDRCEHDLPNEAGVRQALINSLEIATANPTLESLDKVAGALNVRLADLLAEGE
jgi:hypothetical protein